MTISNLFFISLAVMIVGFLLAAINIVTAPKRMFSDKVTSIIVGHVIAWILNVVGWLGMIGFGIAWIVQYLKT